MAAAVLAGFPMENQLAEGDANDRMDCVAASLASAIRWLDRRDVTGRQLKDAAYSVGYTGGTSLVRYVDQASDLARKVYGVSADPDDGEPAQLVASVHALIRRGYPVIATIPSAWGTAHPARQLDHPDFSTHAICFYGELAGGGLEAMNPWGGFRHTGNDAYWSGRLCEGQVWRVYRLAGGAMGVPSGWKDDGATLTAPNGRRVTQGFRTWVLSHEWDAGNTPEEDARDLAALEISNPALGSGTAQCFRDCVLEWTSATGVIRMYAGRELAATRTALAASQALVQRLQAQGVGDPQAAALAAAVRALVAK